MPKHLLGLNVDGASVNTGIHSGLGALMKEDSPWLQTVHCFNHRLELAMKDAFAKTAFSTVQEFLNQLYLLYQQSPKRLRELRRIAEAYEQSITKPTKPYGTRWIDHRLRAMQVALDNYGMFITHIESLATTDSQATRRAELRGYLTRWKDASLPIHIAMYLDILRPLRRLSLGFQQEVHNPVKAVRRVQEFTWTMSKLQLLIESSLDEPGSIMTSYVKFVNEVTENDDDKHFYQNIPLARYNSAVRNVKAHTLHSNNSECNLLHGKSF